MTKIEPQTIVEAECAVERMAVYTEAALHYEVLDGGAPEYTIRLHIEDGEVAAEPVFTLAEARELMAHLGHLIWTAENDARS